MGIYTLGKYVLFDERESGFTAVDSLCDLESGSAHHVAEALHEQCIIFNYENPWHFLLSRQ